MKLTFLLRLFVLGFFSEVVLTSPLVARQNNQCPTEETLSCSITFQLSDQAPISAGCARFADCTYSSPSSVECIIKNNPNICPLSELMNVNIQCNSCGSFCFPRSCDYDPFYGHMNCNDCIPSAT
ncbi:9682_t:CDS:1, partial [Gigaspora margarita]